MKNKAAIVIGVDKPQELTPLSGASIGAYKVAKWLDQDFDVALLTDSTNAPELSLYSTYHGEVRSAQIADAIEEFVIERRNQYEMLLIYFSGHGTLSRNDQWLLSKAPRSPGEAIDLNGAVDAARYCGVPNVVFISDACRDVSNKITLNVLNGAQIFPTIGEYTLAGKVDIIRATSRGKAAFEFKDGNSNTHSVLTKSLLDSFYSPKKKMISIIDGKPIIANRTLESFLQDEVDEILATISPPPVQTLELIIPSSDNIYITEIPSSFSKNLAATPRGSNRFSYPYIDAFKPRSHLEKSISLNHIPQLNSKLINNLKFNNITTLKQVADLSIKKVNELSQIGAKSKSKYKWQEISKSANDLLISQGLRKPTESLPIDVLFKDSYNESISENLLNLPQNLYYELNDKIPTNIPKEILADYTVKSAFSFIGAKIKRAEVPLNEKQTSIEIVNSKTNSSLILKGNLKPSSIVIEFENIGCVVLPAIEGYFGQGKISLNGLTNFNLSSRSFLEKQEYRNKHGVGEASDVVLMRAAVSELLKNNRFVLKSKEEAYRLAESIRMQKAIDPTLGLFASYAYSRSGLDAEVKDVFNYMQQDLNVNIFDVAMLSERDHTENTIPNMIPACPMLTQGWSFINSRSIELQNIFKDGANYLKPSLWTTFSSEFTNELFHAIQKGEFK